MDLPSVSTPEGNIQGVLMSEGARGGENRQIRIVTDPLDEAEKVTISASYHTMLVDEFWVRGAALTGIKLDPSSVSPPSLSFIGTVYLDGKAPQGGASITITQKGEFDPPEVREAAAYYLGSTDPFVVRIPEDSDHISFLMSARSCTGPDPPPGQLTELEYCKAYIKAHYKGAGPDALLTVYPED